MIKPFYKATRRAGCDADLGGFVGLFDLAAAGYNANETVLIGATDGVGTNLRIAQTTKKHSTVGIDLFCNVLPRSYCSWRRAVIILRLLCNWSHGS